MTPRRNFRYQSLLFDHKSTQRTDYQLLPITQPSPTLYQHKHRTPRSPYPGLKNQHTFNLYDGLMPFSLLHKPKDIVRTNPNDCQEKFVKPLDEGRSNAQKTRPRLYMAPGVGVDEVRDRARRDLLVSDLYATAYSRAGERAAAAAADAANRAPAATRPARARPIRLPTYEPRAVPREWRADTLLWEARQLRSCVDPACVFWLTRQSEPKAIGRVQPSNEKNASVEFTHADPASRSFPPGPIENETKIN